MGFPRDAPWELLPQRLGLAALGNSIAPPMAALLLKKIVGAWQISQGGQLPDTALSLHRDPANA
eukprot:11680749-Prorocentrum_lima.AAC.1